jgi:hypothetical protein
MRNFERDREVKAITHRDRVNAASSYQQPDKAHSDIRAAPDSRILQERHDKQIERGFGIEVKTELSIERALDIDTRSVWVGAAVKGRDQELGPDQSV